LANHFFATLKNRTEESVFQSSKLAIRFITTQLELLRLSQRETEVLLGVMQGKDNKAIAVQLSVGASTVRKHLESIYQKLGVRSRTAAIAQTLTKLGVLHALPLS